MGTIDQIHSSTALPPENLIRYPSDRNLDRLCFWRRWFGANYLQISLN